MSDLPHQLRLPSDEYPLPHGLPMIESAPTSAGSKPMAEPKRGRKRPFRLWLSDFILRNHWATYLAILVFVLLAITTYCAIFNWDIVVPQLKAAAVVTCVIAFPIAWLHLKQHEILVAQARQLKRMGETDQMTGLYNRQSFLRRLDRLIASTPHGVSAGAFAYIDADKFKGINDTFGHDVGDKVIELIAAAMQASVRKEDLLSRLGGEEFGIFFTGASVPQAAGAAERLRAELRQRGAQLGVPGLSVSVSIGIASHQPGAYAQSLMRDADRSLYAAKQAGRDSVVIDLKRFRAA